MLRRHALSIDLEEWYHPELVRSCLPAGERVDLAPAATRPILDLLDRRGIQATFFVVGQLAQASPDLIREIAGRGHELACHTFSHRPLWELTPASLLAELADWRRLMCDIVGKGVWLGGFRAPTFSLDERTAWAVDVLAEAGFCYDSSVFPLKTPLYGLPGAPDAPYRITSTNLRRPDPAGRLVEFPLTVYRAGPLALPVSGGVYLRLLPLPVLVGCLRRIGRERPFVLYVHPWEMCNTTPKVRLPALAGLATYYNRDVALDKLARLLGRFEFAPLRTILADGGWLES